jgi:hypothetical protein
MSDAPRVVALVRDLMFASRIFASARTQGLSVKIVRTAAALEQVAGQRLIVDLAEPGAINAAVAWKQRSGGQTVGFVSHIDQQTIADARQAGIDRILSRGGFTAQLDRLIDVDLPLLPSDNASDISD